MAVKQDVDASFNDVNTTLNGKAPLVSPTFTGTITLSGSTSTITLSGDYIYLNLPTVAGPVGTIWNDTGTLKVVPPPA